jgi:hypothetical protein
MDNILAERVAAIREKYGGGTYVTIFPNDIIVPWKALPVGDYLSYLTCVDDNKFPLAIFENEIFTRCVLDQTFVRQMSFLKAGIISTVVENIWSISCPTSSEEISNSLESARKTLQGNHAIIHEFVHLITLAFPYRPEEVYQMNWETLISRVTLAEKKLLQLGMIQQPVEIEQPTAPREKVDPKQMWEAQQGKSPVIDAMDRGVVPDVDFDNAKQEALRLTGHEAADIDVLQHKAIEDARLIHADTLEELRKRRQR